MTLPDVRVTPLTFKNLESAGTNVYLSTQHIDDHFISTETSELEHLNISLPGIETYVQMPLHIQCTASTSDTQGIGQRLPRANETVSKAPETEYDIFQRLIMIQDGAQSDIIDEVIEKTTRQLLASQPLPDSRGDA